MYSLLSGMTSMIGEVTVFLFYNKAFLILSFLWSSCVSKNWKNELSSSPKECYSTIFFYSLSNKNLIYI
jgi:hypothetical protein